MRGQGVLVDVTAGVMNYFYISHFHYPLSTIELVLQGSVLGYLSFDVTLASD